MKTKSKQSRNTRQKKIDLLVKQGKKTAAIKMARDFEINETNPAQRIVDSWLAVGEIESNRKLLEGAPVGFFDTLSDRAKRVTCKCVRDAILNRNAGFFIAIANRLKEPLPRADNLRVGVLRDEGSLLKKLSPKELAVEILGKSATQNQITTVASNVRRLRRKYRES